jgi:PAS domain S-box-containing protein
MPILAINDPIPADDQSLFLRQIVDSSSVLLHTARQDGYFDFLNQTWLDFVGVPLKRLLGWGWTSCLHPDDVKAFVQKMRESFAEGKPFEDTSRLRRADGVYRWMLHLKVPVFDGAGNLIKWNGSSIDIDDLKRAEDHLRDTHIKLAKVSRLTTVAELAASIAHELNQPLMSILANAQAAKKWLNATPPNKAEANSSIERIIRDARAADEAMQHIRALFKQESFDKIAVNIPDILREVVRVVREDPKKRDVPVECEFIEPLPMAHVDRIPIQQVFINLIVNAIEALEEREVGPLVVLRATRGSNGILIQVIDNGPGVDDPDRIFDAFMTTKEKGMGIGLAVSRSIVEAHGGRLWAENNMTGGACFSVALPLSHASPTTA